VFVNGDIDVFKRVKIAVIEIAVVDAYHVIIHYQFFNKYARFAKP